MSPLRPALAWTDTNVLLLLSFRTHDQGGLLIFVSTWRLRDSQMLECMCSCWVAASEARLTRTH